MTTLDQRKIERYDDKERYAINQKKADKIASAEQEALAGLWCLDNGIDSRLVGYSYSGKIQFNATTYEEYGRLDDAGIALLKNKLKKAPFKYVIAGVKP